MRTTLPPAHESPSPRRVALTTALVVAAVMALWAVIVVLAAPAFADEAGTPGHPLPNGLCIQPESNPPFHVPCDSPAATTPYTPAPTSGVVNGEDPGYVERLADGQCVQSHLVVPRFVACPASEAPPALSRPARRSAPPTTTPAQPAYRPAPTLVTWRLRAV